MKNYENEPKMEITMELTNYKHHRHKEKYMKARSKNNECAEKKSRNKLSLSIIRFFGLITSAKT